MFDSVALRIKMLSVDFHVYIFQFSLLFTSYLYLFIRIKNAQVKVNNYSQYFTFDLQVLLYHFSDKLLHS